MMNRLAAGLAVLVAASTPALAQPVTSPPAEPEDGTMVVMQPAQPGQPEVVAVVAPHNENWSNVSHINGQLVPVGQRGDYLIKDKTFNISTNPIGWMMGFYGVSLAHSVSHNVAIRGDVNVFHLENDDGYEVGISAPIYFKRVFSGPFIEPGVIARDLDTGDEQPGLVGPEVLFGWHWTFDSGLNVAAAGGMAKNIASKDMCYSDYCDSPDPVEPAGYFRVGYAY